MLITNLKQFKEQIDELHTQSYGLSQLRSTKAQLLTEIAQRHIELAISYARLADVEEDAIRG